jgi:hypothetical protein
MIKIHEKENKADDKNQNINPGYLWKSFLYFDHFPLKV